MRTETETVKTDIMTDSLNNVNDSLNEGGGRNKAGILENILEIRDLTVKVNKNSQSGTILDNINMKIPRGKIIGLVGESGCGKTFLGNTIMGLVPGGRSIVFENGEVVFNDSIKMTGTDILKLHYNDMRSYRGNRISMIFQEPMSALNPIYKVGAQVAETVKNHNPDLSSGEIKKRVINILKEVGMHDPAATYEMYPHQLSGGMRQRIVIAIAAVNNPDLIIADEPTTALDITISEQILFLLYKIRKNYNSSIILITHDLGVVANMCDEIYVMYRGTILEHGSVDEVFKSPKNPYTVGLMNALPESVARKESLHVIPGNVPSVFKKSGGCKFHARCFKAAPECEKNDPPVKYFSKTHFTCCHLAE
ncbi:MAG: ABC transporter ATP-binding protein [Candidatus Wallbacteria bacterium]